MIRFVTYSNFPLLDLQIEEAYRRRCNGTAVAYVADIDAFSLVRPHRQSRRRTKRSRDWLRRLAWEVYALSSTDREAARRCPSCLIAANTANAAEMAGKPRQRRASR